MFKSKHFMCSHHDIFCVPVKTCPVFQPRDVLCSNRDTLSRSKTTPFFQDSTRHFWPDFGERPGILPVRNPKRKNPGTIAKIPPKMACEIVGSDFRIFFFDFFFQIFFSNFFFEFLLPRRGCAAAAAAAAPPRRGAAAARPGGASFTDTSFRASEASSVTFYRPRCATSIHSRSSILDT